MEKRQFRSLPAVVWVLAITLFMSVAASDGVALALLCYFGVTIPACIPAIVRLMDDSDPGERKGLRPQCIMAGAALSVLEYASWAAVGFLIDWSSKFVRTPLFDMGLHLLALLCFVAGVMCSWAVLLDREASRFNDPERALRNALFLLPPALPFLLILYGYRRVCSLPRTVN